MPNWMTNFALILFILLVITGIVTLLDKLVFSKHRAEGRGRAVVDRVSEELLPVILIVFLLRSFLVEPFKIPSSSMRPTLEVGDFILVNKFTYGIRLPIIEKKIVDINQPQRGDVLVFRYPLDTSLDYIKRVVGVPGDEVVYKDKQLIINGQPQPLKADGSYSYLEGTLAFVTTQRFEEKLATRPRRRAPDRCAAGADGRRADVSRSRNCVYNESGFTCKVPPGSYFMMGDNRDNSEDSRYWGFVPDDHIRGKAFFIWWNWDDVSSFAFKRIGRGIR
jgi:signal peptidase I